MAHIIEGFEKMSAAEQVDARKTLLESLSEEERNEINLRHEDMENAFSDQYKTSYSVIIASWFNALDPETPVKNVRQGLIRFLEKSGMDIYELNDIDQMLFCGKMNIEDDMRTYLNEEIENAQKKMMIEKISIRKSIPTKGLDKLPLATLKAIADNI